MQEQKKYKEKYKAGMIFRSEKYPWADIVIEQVHYSRVYDTKREFNSMSKIYWERANRKAFDRHICLIKGYNYTPDTEIGEMSFTHLTPYPCYFCSVCTQKSMDSFINKYELKFSGEIDGRNVIEQENYFVGFHEEYLEG